MSLQPGDVLGEYTVAERLGRGGMGAVFRAEAPGGEEVALKVLRLDDDDERSRRRFVEEARVILGLDHPRIVAGRGGPQVDGERVFYAMELVRGQDLSRLLEREGRLEPRVALRVLEDVLEALEHAHGRGVVHRDVKPANVFVERSGRAKLGDFGLAHARGATRHTRTGSVIGTPEYMAPEQAEGRELDARCDLYAAGVLLFEMLAGHPPFQAAQPLAVLRMQVERDVPPLPAELDPALDAVVRQAMAKLPAERFADARAMRRAARSIRKRLASDAHRVKGGSDGAAAAVAAETIDLREPPARPPTDRRAEPARRPRRVRREGAVPGAAIAFGAALLVGVLALVLSLAARGPVEEPAGDAAAAPGSASAPAAPVRPDAPPEPEPRPEVTLPTPATRDVTPPPPAPEAPRASGVEYLVQLLDGTELLARDLIVAPGADVIVLRALDDGREERVALSRVRRWSRAPDEPAVDVTLRSGERFRARLVELDLVDGVLVTRAATGALRRDPLPDVADYRRVEASRPTDEVERPDGAAGAR